MNACANSLGDWIREARCWYRSVSLLSVMCLDLAKFRSGVDSKYNLNGTPGQMARITPARDYCTLFVYPLSKPDSIGRHTQSKNRCWLLRTKHSGIEFRTYKALNRLL